MATNVVAQKQPKSCRAFSDNISSALYTEDWTYDDNRLTADADRLFSNNVVRVGLWSQRIKDQTSRDRDSGSEQARPAAGIQEEIVEASSFDAKILQHTVGDVNHYVFLYQTHSWSSLQITEDMLRKLLNVFQVHPSFLNIVHAFGLKEFESNEDMFGDYYVYFGDFISKNGEMRTTYYEISYVLRYVEETGRSSHPWSIRQIGLYHRYNLDFKSSTGIFIQPTDTVKSLITENSDEFPIAFHLSLISTTMRKWKHYLKFLDSKVHNIGQNVRLSNNTDSKPRKIDFEVEFSDVQRLQHLLECFQHVQLVLSSNIEILECIRSLVKGLEFRGAALSEIAARSVDERLNFYASRLSAYQRWTEISSKRVEAISFLAISLLQNRNHAFIGQKSAYAADLAHLSEIDSKTMISLTTATNSDSRMMKLMAVVATLYLPGTFVASIFSTSFVNFYSQQNPSAGTSTAAREAVIFGIATITLMMCTFGGTYLFNHWEDRGRLKGPQSRLAP